MHFTDRAFTGPLSREQEKLKTCACEDGYYRLNEDIYEIPLRSYDCRDKTESTVYTEMAHKLFFDFFNEIRTPGERYMRRGATNMMLSSGIAVEAYVYGIKVTANYLGTFWLEPMPIEDVFNVIRERYRRLLEEGGWAAKLNLIDSHKSRRGKRFYVCVDSERESFIKFTGVTLWSGGNTIIGLPEETLRDLFYTACVFSSTNANKSDFPLGPTTAIPKIYGMWKAHALGKDSAKDDKITDRTRIKIGDCMVSNIILDPVSVTLYSEKLKVNGTEVVVSKNSPAVIVNNRPANDELSRIAKLCMDLCNDIENGAVPESKFENGTDASMVQAEADAEELLF